MAISWDIDYLEVYPDALLLPYNRIPTLSTMSLGAMYIVCCMVAQKFDRTVRVKATSDLLYSIAMLGAHDSYMLVKQIYDIIATTNYDMYTNFTDDPNLKHLVQFKNLQGLTVSLFLKDMREYLIPLASKAAAEEVLHSQYELILSL